MPLCRYQLTLLNVIMKSFVSKDWKRGCLFYSLAEDIVAWQKFSYWPPAVNVGIMKQISVSTHCNDTAFFLFIISFFVFCLTCRLTQAFQVKTDIEGQTKDNNQHVSSETSCQNNLSYK